MEDPLPRASLTVRSYSSAYLLVLVFPQLLLSPLPGFVLNSNSQKNHSYPSMECTKCEALFQALEMF